MKEEMNRLSLAKEQETKADYETRKPAVRGGTTAQVRHHRRERAKYPIHNIGSWGQTRRGERSLMIERTFGSMGGKTEVKLREKRRIWLHYGERN